MAIVDAFGGEGSAADEKTEDLTIQINGIRDTFTVAENYKQDSLKVYRNGQRQITGRTVTITSSNSFQLDTVPSTDEFLLIDYIPF